MGVVQLLTRADRHSAAQRRLKRISIVPAVNENDHGRAAGEAEKIMPINRRTLFRHVIRWFA